MVHGGESFTESVESILNLSRAGALTELAPCTTSLFGGILALKRFRRNGSDGRGVCTAFHRSLPAASLRMPFPGCGRTYHIRRYGFTGSLMRRWRTDTLCVQANHWNKTSSLITLQLGNGCSAAGSECHSMDTSMGLTPLEGLVMGPARGISIRRWLVISCGAKGCQRKPLRRC